MALQVGGYSVNRDEAETLLQKYFPRDAQKTWDRYLLDKVCLIGVKSILEDPSGSSVLSRCPEGKTPVFLPANLPEIVLKLSGAESCCSRFMQMVRGIKLCDKMGFAHLVIPKARIIGDWLIEKRLPLDTNPFEQAKFYLNNREQCTQAILEFTHFALQTGITDMVRKESMFRGIEFPRVDNFPLFRTPEGKIAVGLIDIEHDKDTSCPIKIGEDFDKDDLYVIRKKVVGDLVYFYPYHADLIQQVALQYLDQETLSNLALEQKAAEGIRYLKTLVPDFIHYLKNKRKMTPEVKETIIDALVKEIPVIVKRRQPDSKVSYLEEGIKERQAMSDFIDETMRFLTDLKVQKMRNTSHVFKQCELHFFVSDFSIIPHPYKIGLRFLELLEKHGIINHYCPKPFMGSGSEIVIL